VGCLVYFDAAAVGCLVYFDEAAVGCLVYFDEAAVGCLVYFDAAIPEVRDWRLLSRLAASVPMTSCHRLSVFRLIRKQR
jgi:hypothetical protein